MPVIERDDGNQFAVFTYRELLLEKRGSLLRQEINMLQKQNGDYARFFEQDTGDIEAVFSKEPGYLLAECIWFHFDQPFNMIFCEQLPNGDDAILIVVRGGAVFLDAKVPVNLLLDEFISLATSENEYDVYISGDVPLAKRATDEKYAFPTEMVKSFTVMDSRLFPRLDTEEVFALLPAEQAFKELSVAKSKLPQIMITLIIFGLIGFGVYQALKPQTIVTTKRVFAPAYVDPYTVYKQQLSTPSPRVVLLELTKQIRGLQSVPGWQLTSVVLSGKKLTAQLSTSGGAGDILIAWARNSDSSMTVAGGIATITSNVPNLPIRPVPTKIYNIRDSIAAVYDRLHLFSTDNTFAMTGTVDQGNFVATSVTVTLSGVSAAVMNFVGSGLEDLPVTIGDVNFTVADGLLSGTINLKILGEKES